LHWVCLSLDKVILQQNGSMIIKNKYMIQPAQDEKSALL
jgi:hypothetical protein